MGQERLSQLIGARGRFEPATDARKTLNCVFYRHSDEQRGDALRITSTTTDKFYRDDAVVFYIDFNLTRTNALGTIRNMFHNNLLLGILNVQEWDKVQWQYNEDALWKDRDQMHMPCAEEGEMSDTYDWHGRRREREENQF